MFSRPLNSLIIKPFHDPLAKAIFQKGTTILCVTPEKPFRVVTPSATEPPGLHKVELSGLKYPHTRIFSPFALSAYPMKLPIFCDFN